MLILALDSALNGCSVALCDRASGEVLSARLQEMERGQAEVLPNMVDAVMMDADDPYDKLAFLAFARALGVTLEIPVTSMTTLEALARNVADNPERLPVAAVIDARRDEVYIQAFEADMAPINEPAVLPVAAAAAHLPPGPCLLVGSAAGLLADEAAGRMVATDARPLPQAEVIALHAPIEPAPAGLPEPLYLRPPDARPQGPLANMDK